MKRSATLAAIGLVAAFGASSALASRGSAKPPPPVNCNCDPGGGYWDFVGYLGDRQSYSESQSSSSGNWHLKYFRGSNRATGWFRERGSGGVWDWDAAPDGSHEIDNLYPLSTYDASRVINNGADTFVEVLINGTV